jgi:hypothetical protein
VGAQHQDKTGDVILRQRGGIHRLGIIIVIVAIPEVSPFPLSVQSPLKSSV